jgi:alpha-tubulin suppressor-like RCC1 family protein
VSDFYHDDPVEELSSERKKPKALFGSVLLIFAGGLFLNTTLAANINLNSGGRVEFGQGTSITAACSEGSALTITPQSEFRNEAGAGAHYVKSLQVSGIPSSCDGKDFDISLYDNDPNSDALPLFDTSKRVATVYNNAGTFEQGFQGTGSTVSSASGAFTVTFASPLALSSNAMKVTLQSTEHKAWAQTTISNGNNYSCALLNSSAVKCWGANDFGNLGDGTTTQRLTPTTVSGLGSGVSAIAAGNRHACAVLDTGAVRCWGTNDFGQTGNGVKGGNQTTPVTVAGLSQVKAISVGAHFSCVLSRSGAVKCWGRGTMLGQGSATDRLAPVDVSGLSSGVIAIASGNYHTCAVLNTGAVRCWGDDGRGAVGNGGGGSNPGTITGLGASAIGITGGDRHTCALLSTGAVKCWGWNDLGQIGIAPAGDNSNPQTVSGISSAVALSAGGQTSCALLSSGEVNCWGAGGSGQRGNGTTTDSHIPVTVSGLSSAIAISNGYNHACALVSSGAARCWGSNGNGRLGDGTINNSLTPVSVTGIP